MPATTDPIKLERRAMRIFGCGYAEALSLNDGIRPNDFIRHTKAAKYMHQRYAAKGRGIEWEISFPEWVAVWMESGHFEDRGKGKGKYCMARHGDTGPYKIGNVSIQPYQKNSSEGSAKAKANVRANGRLPGPMAGQGRGWSFLKNCPNRPYEAVFRNKGLGYFATAAEAEKAYREAALSYRRLGLAGHAPIVFRSPV